MAKSKTTRAGSVTVTNIDLGAARLVAQLAMPIFIEAGILEEEGQQIKTGTVDSTVAEVATVHEFGAPDKNIPARSFLRSTVDEHLGYYPEIAAAVNSVISGAATIAAMATVGEKVEKDIVDKIEKGIGPSLSPITVQRKGHSTPLIDTEQLINSISSKVI